MMKLIPIPWLLSLFMPMDLAWADGFGDLTAPIEANSCRLANMYTLNGQDYSGSAGMTSNGQYGTTSSREDCLKGCQVSAQARVEEKPEIYGLRVACFYGKEKLFESEYE